MNKKPDHVIRFGLIKVSIWRNETRSGERHSVSICRLYRDGDLWRESTRFGRDDLVVAAKALDQAHTWIFEQSGNSINAPLERMTRPAKEAL